MKIKFATQKQVRKAHKEVIKKYRKVFQKLAEYDKNYKKSK